MTVGIAHPTDEETDYFVVIPKAWTQRSLKNRALFTVNTRWFLKKCF